MAWDVYVADGLSVADFTESGVPGAQYPDVPRSRTVDAATLASWLAAGGDTIAIAAGSGGVTVDNAKVVKTDILATNGVIHVIDAVILPEDE